MIVTEIALEYMVATSKESLRKCQIAELTIHNTNIHNRAGGIDVVDSKLSLIDFERSLIP